MKLSNKLFKTILALSFIVGLSSVMFGQQIEPSYSVALQIVVGSNDNASRAELPAGLAAVSRDLKSTFGFSSYRLGGTFLGRVTNTGDYSYKSLSNIFGQESDYKSQTFLEWYVRTLKSGVTAKGPQGFQAQGFSFGARVPVTVGTAKDQSGKDQPIVNYEKIGLDLTKVSLPENIPTLVGTLNLPGTSGTLFLIMTVKSTD